MQFTGFRNFLWLTEGSSIVKLKEKIDDRKS